MMSKQKMIFKKKMETIDNVYHRYIECKNLISNILKYGLMGEYLCVTNFDNQHFSLKDIVNTYLEKNILMWMINCF